MKDRRKKAQPSSRAATVREQSRTTAATTTLELPSVQQEQPVAIAEPRETRTGQRALSPLTEAGIFFGLFLVLLWGWVNVGLTYHGAGVVRGYPAFFWRWDFASELLRHPGGASEWLAALLAQMSYDPALGAFALTAQAAVVWAGVHVVLARAGAARLGTLAFIAPLLLLALYARYKHFSSPVTEMAIGSAFMAAAAQFRAKGLPLVSILFGVGLSALAPAILIPFTVVTVLLCCAWRMWAGAILVAVLTPALGIGVGTWVYGLSYSDAAAQLWPLTRVPYRVAAIDVWLLVGAFVCVGVVPALAVVLTHGWDRIRPAKREATKSHKAQRPSRLPWGVLLRVGLPVVLAFAVLKVAHNAELKRYLQVDLHAWNGDWQAVLRTAQKAPRDPHIRSTVAQALFHTDQLPTTLPQAGSADDLLLAKEGPEGYWRMGDIYYDLGYVNMALHYFTEAAEFWGQKPALLRRLALLNLALGNEPTARIYLNALQKVPFHSDWAERTLGRLDTGATHEIEDLAKLRANMMRADSVVRQSAAEELAALVNANPRNTMAVQYLITHFLLTRDLESLAKTWMVLGLGAPPSKLWSEALYLANQLPNKPAALPVVTSPEMENRYREISRVLRSAGGNPHDVAIRLQHLYADSYILYYFLEN